MRRISLLFSSVLLCLLACSNQSASTQNTAPSVASFGSNPELPAPKVQKIPTIHVAPAIGWPAEGKPTAAAGFKVQTFASELDHPRWLYVLPNGDVLVAETNAPPKPDDNKGIKGWIMKRAMKRAGAGTPSANRITLLRDADGDGIAETRSVFLKDLNSPFGMALVDEAFYVADTDAVLRFPYRRGDKQIVAAGVKVADLPAGRLNHHWTKNIVANADGKKLYVTVGSNSNVGENGLDREEGRAAIWEVNLPSGQSRIFASGLRNPVGLAWQPQTGALWTSVNERDALGDDLVPDYMTAVQENGFYGWPYSYYGQHVDERVKAQRDDLVSKAIVPDYALGAHTASLGLAFYTGTLLPAHYRGGAFVGQHGSWNRRPRSGYKLIFVPFAQGRPAGPPEDILTGFLDEKGDALGRPVGVAIDRQGAILLADDVGNRVWRVTPDTAKTSAH